MAEVAASGVASKLEGLLAAQRRAEAGDGIPDLAARRADLDRLKRAIRARRNEFVRAAAEDFGTRPDEDTLVLDVGPVVQSINHMRGHLARWMRPERRPVPLVLRPGRARVLRQPLGIVGIMAPWNYPFGLTLLPLATALAAGNRAMIKPSELAPSSARAVSELVQETFAPEKVVVVEGGAEVGAAFSSLPFDHLFYTGSTAIGRKVMAAAARNLVPVTLELGGKTPVILARDADFAKAARDVAFGKIANSGQTCIAPDYVLVHEEDADAFVARLAEEWRRGLLRAGRRGGAAGIIRARHGQRLAVLLDEARSAGATVFSIDESSASHGAAPAIVLDPPAGTRLMAEEIFGPLLPVVTYRELDDAIDTVRAGDHPLALYLYTATAGLQARVLSATRSGNVTLNGVMTHFAVESLPFGGVGASGMGAYHGRAGFDAMTHARGVFEESRRSLVPLGRPGGRFARLFARYMMR